MSSPTFLEQLIMATRQRLAERQAATSVEVLREEIQHRASPLDIVSALRTSNGGMRAIAEIKRASPSKGPLRPDLDPVEIALLYAENGVAAISVLTEQDFFRGSLADLRHVKAAVPHIPVLRKDFTVDPYQILEARAAGADTYLLIVAMLDDEQLARLLLVGRNLGMEPIVEVHNADETRRAVTVGARIIGVNARNLHTFAVDTMLVRDLRPIIPSETVVIAESGIASLNDVVRMRGYGTQAILVGETLMRADDPGAMLRHLIAIPEIIRHMTPDGSSGTVTKLCGMRTPADALAAYSVGADLIGMVFAAGKRQVTEGDAAAIIQALPSATLTVGVFVNESPEKIATIVQHTGVRAVQLSGDEWRDLTPYCDLGMPLIVAVRDPTAFAGVIAAGALPILDSAPSGAWGGTGQTGDWQSASILAKDIPLLLAGGLNPANVADAICAVHPWGVDVSSGIETIPFSKDPARMAAFVDAVRNA